MQKLIVSLVVASLVLAGCAGAGEEMDREPAAAASSATASVAPVGVAPVGVAPVSMPEGTWEGELRTPWLIGTIAFTLPAECREGERCGSARAIYRDGDTCRTRLVFGDVTDVGFMLDALDRSVTSVARFRNCALVDDVVLTPDEGGSLSWESWASLGGLLSRGQLDRTVRMPEGTWEGGASTMFLPLGLVRGRDRIADYWVRITLPAECVMGERCGDEEIASLDGGASCRATLVLAGVGADGTSSFERGSTHGECPDDLARLEPTGDTIEYTALQGWQTFALDRVNGSS